MLPYIAGMGLENFAMQEHFKQAMDGYPLLKDLATLAVQYYRSVNSVADMAVSTVVQHFRQAPESPLAHTVINSLSFLRYTVAAALLATVGSLVGWGMARV